MREGTVTIAVAVSLGARGVGTMHVDVEDSRPGGLIPGEETDRTSLVMRVLDSTGQQFSETRVPVELVRAAFARRRIGL